VWNQTGRLFLPRNFMVGWKPTEHTVISERQSLFLALARCASAAAALSVAGPVLADSDRPDLANATGDDPTHPLGKIELLERNTEAPGPGASKRERPNESKPTRRSPGSMPFRVAPQWELNFRAENSVYMDERSNAREPDRRGRVRLRQPTHPGLDRARPQSTMGGRAWRATL
jgi:hypothetical protein